MKIVIAGNYRQYQNYLRENNLSPQEAKYVSRSEQLFGYSDVEVVKVGEWWLNPCAYDSYLEIIEGEKKRVPDGVMESGTPCVVCNERHKGSNVEYKGHAHKDKDGVGNVRLLVLGNGHSEYCWRCGCQKSGWVNIANEVSSNCPDSNCVCHVSERAE